MDDNLSPFEDELRKLRPVGISRRLQQGIASTLAAAPTADAGSWWQRLGFARPSAAWSWGLLSPVLSAAAAIIVAQAVGYQHPPTHAVGVPLPGLSATAKNPPVADTVRASSVLYKTQDDGVVFDGARGAVHRFRYRSADLVRWRNPATGVLWEVAYPREDVTLAPIHVE